MVPNMETLDTLLRGTLNPEGKKRTNLVRCAWVSKALPVMMGTLNNVIATRASRNNPRWSNNQRLVLVHRNRGLAGKEGKARDRSLHALVRVRSWLCGLPLLSFPLGMLRMHGGSLLNRDMGDAKHQGALR